MSQAAFSFLEIPKRRPKPRTKGLTCVTDVTWTTAALDDFLSSFSDMVDRVKMINHFETCGQYTDEFYRHRIKTLERHQVESYIGGLTFEVAYVQGHHKQFFQKSLDLGFKIVEIAEDAIPYMPPGERIRIIKEARGMGLRVFTEYGKKYPDKPLEVGEAVRAIEADLEAGAEHVVMEKGEIRLLRETKNFEALAQIARAVGIENLFFELREGYDTQQPWPELCRFLFEVLGTDVNVMNINVEEAYVVDNMRRHIIKFLDDEVAKRQPVASGR